MENEGRWSFTGAVTTKCEGGVGLLYVCSLRGGAKCPGAHILISVSILHGMKAPFCDGDTHFAIFRTEWH